MCHPALIPWTAEGRGVMRGVFMGYGGLGSGACKEGSSCSSSSNTPTFASHSRLLFRLESCTMHPEIARTNWFQSGLRLASSLRLILSPTNIHRQPF